MLNVQTSRSQVYNVDPDEVAPIGSTLFAILSVLLDTSKGSQTDLVNFLCELWCCPNIFGNYGV